MPVPRSARPAPAGPTAVAEFVRLANEFDDAVRELGQMSSDHFGVLPDDVNWGHVGTVREYLRLLRSVTDSHFRRGEFAADAE